MPYSEGRGRSPSAAYLKRISRDIPFCKDFDVTANIFFFGLTFVSVATVLDTGAAALSTLFPRRAFYRASRSGTRAVTVITSHLVLFLSCLSPDLETALLTHISLLPRALISWQFIPVVMLKAASVIVGSSLIP